MTKQQALNQLRLMQAWHEDNGNGPNADYDAIVYALGVIEEAPERLDTLVKALEAEHKKLREMQSATDKNVATKISREPLELARAIDGLTEWQKHVQTDSNIDRDITVAIEALKAQLGTNLAEVGTDCISRQEAIDALDCINGVEEVLRSLPPAQPHTYRGVTLNDVMMYFDSLEGNEDAWTELCSCFECRGWELIRIQDGDARQNFLDIVYAELADDPDNNRANKIIEAADEYAESAQLGTDCISRQAAIADAQGGKK